MPFVPHTRLTFGGRITTGTPAEQWVCSIALGGDNTDPVIVEPSAAEFTAIRAALQAWHVRVTTSTWVNCYLDWAKLAQIGTDGRYVGNSRYSTANLGSGGSSSTNPHPSQIARVITFDSARKNPTGRGRIFSPCPAVGLFSDGLPNVTATQDAATSATTLVNDLNAAVAGLTRVVVASSKGYNSAVTGVRVGRVLDTVRSRRAQLAELYVSGGAITNPA
jgi:hypothetical protein